MKKKNFFIGASALLLMAGMNFSHALNEYGFLDGNLCANILAQTTTTTTGDNTTGGTSSNSNCGCSSGASSSTNGNNSTNGSSSSSGGSGGYLPGNKNDTKITDIKTVEKKVYDSYGNEQTQLFYEYTERIDCITSESSCCDLSKNGTRTATSQYKPQGA